jgi:hypothetical protein
MCQARFGSFSIAGGGQFRIGRQPVDIFHPQAAIGDRFLDRGQRVRSKRDVGETRDLREAHAADGDLAAVFPHGASFHTANHFSLLQPQTN